MQQVLFPRSCADRQVHPTVRLVILLVCCGILAPMTECAERRFPADPGYFAAASWQCCASFPDIAMGDKEEPCSGDPGNCFAGPLELEGPDGAGLERDTWYFLGYQAATVAILYAMPESVSGWSDEQKSGYSASIWWDNIRNPQIDSDDFYINYLLHPYWGASYFVRARERGYNNAQSFWYSAWLSTMYEFGFEALFEEPSIQDLFVTPIAGSVLGVYFMHVRDGIHEREVELGYRTTKDKWLLVLTDPLGSLNRQFDKLFGWDAQLQVRPYRYVQRRDPNMTFDTIQWKQDRVYGLEFRLQW